MLESRKKIRRILIPAGLLLLLPLLLLAHPRGRAAFRLTSGFQQLEQDSRVYFETGAEVQAMRFAEALPDAIARVEECHGQAFKSDFRLYVCASHESFSRHLGETVDSPVRGMKLFRDIWVSPKAFDFRGADTHRQTIIHELSHLHLSQHMGLGSIMGGLPTWFVEGLADWVADTGNEIVTYQEALDSFAHGRYLVPDAKGRFLFPKTAQDYGVSWPMLHRQSRMFVEYLHDKDEALFKDFVVAVSKGMRFKVEFGRYFRGNLDSVWNDFLSSLDHRIGSSIGARADKAHNTFLRPTHFWRPGRRATLL